MATLVAASRGRYAIATAWTALALVLLLLAATPFGHATYHHLPGRGGWFAGFLALACLLAGAISLAEAPIAALAVAALFLGGIGQLWLTESDWFSALVLAPKNRADLAMLALIPFEGLVALALLWRAGGPSLLQPALRIFGIIRPLVFFAVLTIASVSLFRYLFSHDPRGYLVKLAMMTVVTAIHLASTAALLAAPDLPLVWTRLRRAARLPLDPAIAFGLLAFALAALMAWFAFHGHGAVEDETAYLFQARTYAAGLLVAPPLPPGVAPSFEYYLLDATSGGWLATTPPGWPAVLALGVLLGAPWLVNPLLCGLAVFLAHRLFDRIADRWIANLTALLMATSPWVIAASASLMTHALSGALIAGAWLALVVARDRFLAGERPWPHLLALLAGLLFGWLFLTRALEGVLIGGLTGLWLLWTMRARGWSLAAALALGFALSAALLLAYNARITGDPLVMPLTEYLNRLWGTGGNDFGFGPKIGPPEGWRNLDLWPGHSPLEGAINTISGMPSLNLELLGWPVGSLALILILLVWGRVSGAARALALVAGAVILVHLFYWFNAVFYVGPRYWYAAVLPLMALSAFGARTLIGRLEAGGLSLAGDRVLAALVLLAFFATTIFLPWRGIEKYSQRVAASHLIEQWAARLPERDVLMFVDKETFSNAAILNDPLRRENRPLYALDRGSEANARVVAAFPGRSAVRVDCTAPEAGDAALLAVCAAVRQGK